MSTLLPCLAVFPALLFSAFFSGTETGFLSLSRGRVLHMARAGSRKARRLHSALSDMTRTSIVILMGNNIANVVFSASSAVLIDRMYPSESMSHLAWTFASALVMLTCGEFLPKLFCAARPLSRMLMLSGCYRLVAGVLTPLSAPFVFLVTGMMPQHKGKKTVSFSPDHVLRILNDKKDGVMLTELESALIGRIMVLRAKGRDVTPESLLEVLTPAP